MAVIKSEYNVLNTTSGQYDTHYLKTSVDQVDGLRGELNTMSGDITALSSGKANVGDCYTKAESNTELAKKYGDNDFTILTVNGGNNVVIDSRYVLDNPFPNYYVNCVAEIQYNGQWFIPCWLSIYINNIVARGTMATQYGNNIVVQTGKSWIANDGASASGQAISIDVALTSAPCRVKVWKVGKITV